MISGIKSIVLCCIAASLLLAHQGRSFQAASFVTRKHCPAKCTFCSVGPLHGKKRSLENDGDETEEPTGIPQLPAFGASSFSNASTETTDGLSQSLSTDNVDAAFVSPKFKLQYTCNICDTRNSHMVSRMAYRTGMVIAICKGCKSKHLIADNLNETPGLDGDCNIEDYFKAKGLGGCVNRVSPEVFHLEQIIRFNCESGSLVGDDGNPVLE